MITYRITEAKKDISQQEQLPYLNVSAEFVTEEGEVITERNYGYPLGTSAEDIKDDLTKVAHTLELEKEQRENEVVLQQADQESEATIAELLESN